MLITKFVEINITKNNIAIYRKKLKGKIELKIGIINIPVELLSKGSHRIVEVECDNCGKVNTMLYKSYIGFTKDEKEKYFCKRCNNIKVRETNMKIYGVVCNSQLIKNKEKVSEKWKNKGQDEKNNIKIKRRKTKFDKYGDDTYRDIEKYKKTCLEKYGVDNVSKLNEIKNKVVSTKLEKFGCINNSQTLENREKVATKWKLKSKEEIDQIVNNRKIIIEEKYGSEFYSQTEEYKEKYKKTCLKKYGFEYFTQSDNVKEKVKQTRILIGIQISDDKLSDWEIYKRKVKNLTNKVKKIIFENWNGYDYYDNEYIKENFSLNYIDVNYPTIDHKISIFYGFENGISPENISNIDNLCITKRRINSSKNRNNFF